MCQLKLVNDSCTRMATSVVIGTAERSLSSDLLMPASASLCACMADLVSQVLILMGNIPNFASIPHGATVSDR